MGKRGGKSARIASVQSDLADRLEREYRLQPLLASQYASQVTKAAGEDLGQCNGKWLSSATKIPVGYVCYVLRALEDHLSGSPVYVSVGDKRDAPGETVPAAMEAGLHSMAMVAPREAAVKAAAAAGDNITARGTSQSLPSQGAASEANSVTAHFLAPLEDRGCMSASTQRVKSGFEMQWEMSVAAALSDMQS
jgi:hypothetical protein